MNLDDGHRPERRVLTKTSLLEVSGTVTISQENWDQFRRAVMPDFNNMGITVEQLMTTIKQNIIPDDGEAYQVTYVNKPTEHFIEIQVEKMTQAKDAENQIVATFNIGHAIMQTDQGAFSLEEYWVNTTTYPPGEVNA